MTLEEFNKLTDDEKQLELDIIKESEQKVSDLTAERESLKKELDEVNKLLDGNKKELQATKELNYTLARKVDTAPKKSFEETLHDIFSKKEETKK